MKVETRVALNRFALVSSLIAVLIAFGIGCQGSDASTTADAPHATPQKPAPGEVLTGQAAFGGYDKDAPGVIRKITVDDLPAPFASKSVNNSAHLIRRPNDAMPQAPKGFQVQLYAKAPGPREIITAPNGDLFVAESLPDKIEVFRGTTADGKPQLRQVFASGLDLPFGMAFYPPGPDPKWLYIGNTGSVVRFPYHNGDLQATGPSEMIASDIPSGGRLTGGGHWTRDVRFTPDGKHMFVSVGSATNDQERGPEPEYHRADILEMDPDGKNEKVYASGIRNAVGLAVQPGSGQLWCSVNERDGLGDDLPPDYITRVKAGGFYGWPWFYIGNHLSPGRVSPHPGLGEKVIVPDVLIQAHSASLCMTFYTGSTFPAQYQGQAFAAEHGSWNRELRTAYKVIIALLKDGQPTGEYEDFLTGFVTPDGDVWGRPVGVTVAPDGALMVTDDGSGSIWRVQYVG